MIECRLYFGLVKKGHNSVKMLSMTFKFKDDLHFMMLYPSERNVVYYQKLLIKNHNLAKIKVKTGAITQPNLCGGPPCSNLTCIE